VSFGALLLEDQLHMCVFYQLYLSIAKTKSWTMIQGVLYSFSTSKCILCSKIPIVLLYNIISSLIK